MKKRNSKNQKQTGLKMYFWILDGFNGFLALMIYNFILYLSKILNLGGILGKLEESSGYFYMNSFVTFGLDKTSAILILASVLLFAFFLGTIIGHYVRKFRKR